MSAQELAAAFCAIFITAMIWLRARMHYVRRRRGVLRLERAGAYYFAGVILVLASGWFLAPPLGGALVPAAGASSTLTRVCWFLATYYLAIFVHRLLERRDMPLYAPRDAP